MKSYFVSMKKDQLHTVFHISQNQEAEYATLKYVQLNTENLQGYVRERDLEDMKIIKFRSEEQPATDVLYIEILQMDSDTDEFYEKNIDDAEEFESNGHKAVLMKSNQLAGSQYTVGKQGKTALVFYEDYGYALLVQGIGMPNSSDQSFFKLVQKITLLPATKDTADVVRPIDEYMAEIKAQEKNVYAEQESSDIFPEDKMCDLNGTQIYWGISYHIDQIEVRDHLRGLDQSRYQDDALDNISRRIGVDENLNLIPYRRETVHFGDGYETPEQYVQQSETVTPKLVLVTMTIKNISSENDHDMLQVASPLAYIHNTDGQTTFDQREFERGEMGVYYRDCMPVWISDSEDGSWFYFKKLQIGESATIQLGYLVDEDMLDEMVMEFNFGDGLHDGVWNFIDMRSAIL